MTYRERRLARAERLREWAEKRAARVNGNFKRAHDILSMIPAGQPILVGHHSEKRHRRDLDRADRAMRAGVENERAAASMASRADSIEASADRAIYMDDPDALERVTDKLAELEAKRDRMKKENAAFRKGPAAYAAFLGITAEQEAARRARITDPANLSWCRVPYAAYELSNLGGTITKERKRLAQLTAAKTSSGAAFPSAGDTAITRAGLVITAGMTTPRRAWKKPRAVWNVSGNLAYWRPILIDRFGGTEYGGLVSFYDDPTEAIADHVARVETAGDCEPAAPAETDGRA